MLALNGDRENNITDNGEKALDKLPWGRLGGLQWQGRGPRAAKDRRKMDVRDERSEEWAAMAGEVDVKGILDSMAKRIVARFRPEKIILFGSYALGDATCDSDLDLLIITDIPGSRRQLTNEIDLLLADRMVPLDLIVLTPEELERQKGLVGTLAHEAAREGVVIYERAA